MDSKIKIYWLYVLKLEGGKYYVGITSKTPEKRLAQHHNSFLAAAWTKKHKPIAIISKKMLGKLTLQQAQKYENKVVRTYIKKYGINNVRGGDIAYSGTLIKRFGRYISADDWEVVTVIAFLILVIFILGPKSSIGH